MKTLVQLRRILDHRQNSAHRLFEFPRKTGNHILISLTASQIQTNRMSITGTWIPRKRRSLKHYGALQEHFEKLTWRVF